MGDGAVLAHIDQVRHVGVTAAPLGRVSRRCLPGPKTKTQKRDRAQERIPDPIAARQVEARSRQKH